MISKPSALARVFKRKGSKKVMKPREKQKAITDIKISSEDDTQSSSVFDFEENHGKGHTRSNFSKSPVRSPPPRESASTDTSNMVAPKLESVSEIKAPKHLVLLNQLKLTSSP